MHIFKKGEAVSVLNSQLTGTITNISADGQITIALDIGGDITTTSDNLSPATANPGQFQNGHPYHGPNPDMEEHKADAKEIKQNMLNELAPFFNRIGTYVGQIRSPEKKIEAMAKMAPYILPALSRVEFTDETPRNLTEEQKLEEFIKSKKEQK